MRNRRKSDSGLQALKMELEAAMEAHEKRDEERFDKLEVTMKEQNAVLAGQNVTMSTQSQDLSYIKKGVAIIGGAIVTAVIGGIVTVIVMLLMK